MKHDHRQFDDALGAIEGAVLPGVSRLLDSLIDSAAIARPGHDAEAFAGGIRGSAAELETLTRLLAAIIQPAESTSA